MSWHVSLVRHVGAYMGIALALLTTVTLPIAGVWQLWQWAYQHRGLQSLLNEAKHQIALISVQWPLPEFHLVIPVPPGGEWIAAGTFWALVPILGCLALADLCLPMRHRVISASRTTALAVASDHPVQTYAFELSQRYRTGPIQVYVSSIPGIQAFVLSSPWRRHAIVISRDLIMHAPAEMTRWVLAHEVGHIHYGDTRSASLMLLSLRGIMAFAWLKLRLTYLVLYCLAQLPVLRLVALPLAYCYDCLARIGRVGRYIGGVVFRVFDRWASRRMELRADAFAAAEEGTEAGIALFEAISYGFEPRFGFMATHPTPAKRIESLHRYSYCLDTE